MAETWYWIITWRLCPWCWDIFNRKHLSHSRSTPTRRPSDVDSTVIDHKVHVVSVINVYVTFSALMLSLGWHEGHQPVISTAATTQQCCWLIMTTCWQHAVYKSGMMSQKGSWSAKQPMQPLDFLTIMVACWQHSVSTLQSWTLSPYSALTLLVEWLDGRLAW